MAFNPLLPERRDEPRIGQPVRDWLARQRIALAVLFLLTGLYAFRPPLFKNEADSLPLARQFLDPQWLPHDWYLNQPPGYRAAFDTTAGWLAALLPFPAAAVVGRLLVFALFALTIQTLAHTLRLGAAETVLGLLAFLVPCEQSLIAGEWMVMGLEAKPFAYTACVLALAVLLRGRLALAFFLFGLAVTFHVLVGLYATLCAAALLLGDYFCHFFLSPKRKQGLPLACASGSVLEGSLRRLVAAALCFMVAAGPGLWAVVEHLQEPGGEEARQAAHIYVHARLPWHLLPAYWLAQYWPVLAGKLVEFAVCTVGLILIARRHSDERHRLLASYALISLGFFAVGLFWVVRGSDGMLTFYWFRFPDSIVPFAGCLLLAGTLGDGLRRLRWGPTVLSLGCAAALAGVGIGGTVQLGKLLDGPVRGWDLEPARVEVQLWVRDHTPRQAIFFVDPFWSEFYVLAGRSPFVTFKNFPQTRPMIIEWYQRMAGRDADPFAPLAEVDPRPGYERRFRRLTAADIRGLAAAYGITHAIVEGEADPFAQERDRPREMYRNEGYIVYQFPGE